MGLVPLLGERKISLSKERLCEDTEKIAVHEPGAVPSTDTAPAGTSILNVRPPEL